MNMQNRYDVEVGTFEVTSNSIVVSDPCYDRDVWCSGEISPVKRGTWHAVLVMGDQNMWGNRVCELIAHHESTRLYGILDLQNFEAGVDSGQMSIVSSDKYLGGEAGGDYGTGGWYDLCCNTTHPDDDSPRGGVIPGGCVSSSGFGDGGYSCFTKTDDAGFVIGVKVIFIRDEEDEEDEENEFYSDRED